MCVCVGVCAYAHRGAMRLSAVYIGVCLWDANMWIRMGNDEIQQKEIASRHTHKV